MRLLLLLLLALCCASDAVEVEAELLRKAVDALRRSVEYMERRSSEINLDGALGCRLTAEFLQLLVAADPGVFKVLGEDMRQKLIEIQQKARHSINQALPFIQKDTPGYFRALGSLLYPSDVLRWFTSRTTNPSLKEIPLPCEIGRWNESMSDKCFQEVYGTRSEKGSKCDLSDFCLRIEMRPKLRGYALTHQVLYFQLLEMTDCLKNVKILNDRNMQNMRNYFCANVMRDAERIAGADFPDSHRDLFMEQIGLCGQWGYSDFYRPEWLKKILEWQAPEGCFTRGRGWRCTEDLKPDSHIRVKRNEKELSDGCFSHKTGVALIALAVSIRFCAESVAAEYLPNLKPWQHVNEKL